MSSHGENLKTARFQSGILFSFTGPYLLILPCLKRKLYEIPFDRIEDPTISSLFHEKLVELEMKFSMVRDRNTRNFFFGSMQLYGEIDDELLELAKSILKNILPYAAVKRLENNDQCKCALPNGPEQEINLYRAAFPEISIQGIHQG